MGGLRIATYTNAEDAPPVTAKGVYRGVLAASENLGGYWREEVKECRHGQEHGGGWENFKRYQAEQPPANLLTQSLGGAQQPDAWDRSMVPYAKLQEFAEHYWDTHNDKFKHLASLWRGWWINDSILDGVNVYMEYQQRYGGQGNADFIGYKDGTLDRLMRKK